MVISINFNHLNPHIENWSSSHDCIFPLISMKTKQYVGFQLLQLPNDKQPVPGNGIEQLRSLSMARGCAR